MTIYSKKLSRNYSKNRDKITSTDGEVFSYLDKMDYAGKAVLDHGCGDGRYAFYFTNKGAKSVVGVDISLEMIDLATKNLIESKSKRIKFVKADVLSLPFEKDSFDFVFSNFVLHHCLDSQRALAEIFRVLRKGGILAATMSSYNVKAGGETLLNTELPIRLGSQDSYITVHTYVKSFSGLTNELEKAGFKILRHEAISNPDAQIDPSYEHKGKLEKLTSFIVVEK